MKIRLYGVRIHISILFVVMLLLAIFAGFIFHSFTVLFQYSTVFLVIMLHESGHIAIARLNGGRLVSINILPVGMNAEIDLHHCTSKGILFTYSAGPAVNLILSGVAYIVYFYNISRHEYLYIFLFINLYLAFFNLIPVYPLDGGKLLNEILKDRIGLFASAKYLRYLTIILALLFIGIGMYQIFYGNINPSLLFIGVYMLIFLSKDRMETSFMNMRQFMTRRSKLKKRGIYPVREIVVLKDIRLKDILKNIDFDRFHLITILDDDLRIIKTITEYEMLEALLKYSNNITFEELIETIQ